MQITDDHVEWAVVNRLQKMLDDSPHPHFNVTHTYALFVPIVCWTLQRIRTNGTTEADTLARGLLTRLQGQKVEESPWKVTTDGFEKFKGMSVARFLINLRNAAAHGDATRVKPIHRISTRQSNRELVGFSFDCEEKENRQVAWSGTIDLLENDLRRVGIELARQFCNSLRHSDKNRHDSFFGRDADRYVVEKAA